VVEAVQQMQADGLAVTADSLAQYLTDQGFRVTVHNTAINSIRMWLAKAGLFSTKGWDVDPATKERILGLSDASVGILAALDDEQRAFVKALCQINPSGWYRAADVRDLAETVSGLRLSRVSLPEKFLQPLERAGLVEYTSKGTAGGKSALLRTTTRFNVEILEAFVGQAVKDLDKTLVAYYKERPEDIYSDLASTDRFRKGRALEAYAVYIMRLLGLRFVGWRKRADETGGAEVDVMLEGVFGGTPTRWQVQCKNTPSGAIDLEDVAREVGIAVLNHATHILIIANGRITKDAREFATGISLGSPFTVFLLDKDDFDVIRKNAAGIGNILRLKSEELLRVRAARHPSRRAANG
jgi:site-specific DNA-methyltransferase (cytosine-N4-specific)